MRKLHLVGLTTDRDGLIFTARKGSKSGGYIVPLDKKVLAAIAAAGDDANGEPVEPASKTDVEVVPKRLRSESALTPREMQARLRAGRTIDEVANEAGVDTEWVARFAVPILAEQAQVVELARGLVYAKPRLGESTETLGASVVQNLSDKGVFLPDDVASAGWSAFQLHDSVWMVRFRYQSRGRDQEAHWEIDVPTGRLRARNRLASDLGYVGPDRWRADDETELPADDEAPSPPAKAVRRRVAPAPARRPAAKAPAPARRSPAAKKAPARSAAPARSTRATPARSTAARNVKAAAPKKAVTRTPAAPAKGRAAAKSAPRPAAPAKARSTAAPPAKSTPAPPAKSASRRRATKAVPAPEAGPTAGSGGVRIAVARVSAARVAASMATAEREPWAAAVRRPTARAGAGATLAGPPVKQPASRDRGVEATEAAGRFQPRPLPPPGSEPLPPRVRKVSLPRPRIAAEGNGAPPVSLPSSRRQAQDTDVMPAVERPKRRRLRSR